MNYQNFKRFVKEKTEGFDFGDSKNEDFLKNLVNYFVNEETEYDTNKGLLIRGGIGVGKTSILKLVQLWLPGVMKFAYNPANEVVSQYNISGDEGVEVFKKKKNRLFDDIGAEDIGKYFGNNVEVFQKIIYSRYDGFRYSSLKTHFTTNLTNEQLKVKYGDRAYDRLKEMCTLVNWNESISRRGKAEFFIKKEVEVVKPVLQEEKNEIRKTFLQNCIITPFDQYKKGVDKFDFKNLTLIFHIAMRKGALKITKEELEYYRAEAIKSLQSDVHKSEERNDKKQIALVKLANSLKDNNTDVSIKERAAAIYMKDLFRRFVADGVEVRDWISEVGAGEV